MPLKLASVSSILGTLRAKSKKTRDPTRRRRRTAWARSRRETNAQDAVSETVVITKRYLVKSLHFALQYTVCQPIRYALWLSRFVNVHFVFLFSFLSAIAECFGRLSHGLGVCQSVHLSVCASHYCIVSKRCKLGSWNFHCGCPKHSSFSWQIFVPINGCKNSPRKKASKRGIPWKKRYFAAFGSFSVKTVADRYRCCLS